VVPFLPAPHHAHAAPPPPVQHLALTPPPRAFTAPGAPGAPATPASTDDAPDQPLSPQEVLDGATVLLSEGRFGPARELLERAMERGDDDLAVRLTLANLNGVLRRLEAARRGYEAAIALEPLSAEAHLFYGIHLFGAGEADAAARELSRALFLDPDLVVGHYYLGRCREAQRDAARARLAYRNAMDAFRREPRGRGHPFLGYYPDVPEDGAAFARAAEYALAAL
jgi:chemotaxis protein methyltransferase CheR